jgi:hypothetical protein
MKRVVALPPSPWPGVFIVCLASTNRPEDMEEATKALAALENEREHRYIQSIQFALGYMTLRQPERAVALLGESCRNQEPMANWIHILPVFDPLRGHESFTALLQKVGLPPKIDIPRA